MKAKVLLTALVIALAGVTPAGAQMTGQINGTISDPTGGVAA